MPSEREGLLITSTANPTLKRIRALASGHPDRGGSAFFCEGFQSVGRALTAGAEPRDAGVASALPNVAQQIGGALGPALLNTIWTSAVASYRPTGVPVNRAAALAAASVHGDTVAFSVVYVILFVSAVLCLLVLRRGRIPGAPGAVPAM